jgi:hypothetical protein
MPAIFLEPTLKEIRRPLILPPDTALLARTEPLSRCLQLDNRGCFPACLAMLSGKPYEKIAELAAAMGWLDEIRRVGTYRDKQQILFAMTRISVGHTVSSTNWRQLRQLALVTLRYPAFGSLHSVVYDPVAGGVLDPSPDVKVEVRRDFDNMQMIGYLPVLQLPTNRTAPRPYRLRRFAEPSRQGQYG